MNVSSLISFRLFFPPGSAVNLSYRYRESLLYTFLRRRGEKKKMKNHLPSSRRQPCPGNVATECDENVRQPFQKSIKFTKKKNNNKEYA